jgi:acetyltransferase-like isoleucine patch superfamily enzyme
VPPWGVVVGNPGRVIRIGDPDSNTTEVAATTL